MEQISHLARRKIEAQMIGRLYRAMCGKMGQEQALYIVRHTLDEAAREEGQAFAQRGIGNVGLEHFREVLGLWDDALELEVVEASDQTLRFNVRRCKYIEAYRLLGLPPELVETLSCARDAPFAQGYSAKLSLTRTQTLAQGGKLCDFCYTLQP